MVQTRSSWKNGTAALHEACKYTNDGVVKVLLDAGVDPNAKDCWGNTALLWTGFDMPGSIETMSFLLEAGADPNIQSKRGWTVLMWAAGHSDSPLEYTELLLKAGADPNIQNSEGKTALMFLASYKRFDGMDWELDEDLLKTTKLLLKAGADPNIQDAEGKTALHLAVQNESRPVVMGIFEGQNQQGNLDFDIKDAEGKTFLGYVCSESFKKEIFDMTRMLHSLYEEAEVQESEPEAKRIKAAC